jgi:hypothetical protein
VLATDLLPFAVAAVALAMIARPVTATAATYANDSINDSSTELKTNGPKPRTFTEVIGTEKDPTPGYINPWIGSP